MKIGKIIFVLFFVFCLTSIGYGASEKASVKKRILVVDSYHKEYLWSQYTNEGFCAAMLKFGYFDNKGQSDEYTKNDYVETSTVITKKLWMDAKRKTSKKEMAVMTNEIMKIAKEYGPDLIFLGEDDAAEYIGDQYLDSGTPVVFWGINDTPVKYGLVDKEERPGHNVTGVYQTTYYKESLELLKKLVPTAKTFAVLSDATTTGRIFIKSIAYLSRKGELPFKLVDEVSTDKFDVWKKKALALQKKVDVFFVAQYAGMKDEDGNPVPDNKAAAWYLANIRIPEAAGFKHRVVQGMLCAADDSGFNQGYEAVVIAHDILAKGAKPAEYPPRAPKRGPLMVNKQRAKMLGITLTPDLGIEEYIEEAAALKDAQK